jgi:hypothetical protein
VTCQLRDRPPSLIGGKSVAGMQEQAFDRPLLQVKEYLMALPERGVLADVGCGNGKYFAVRPDLIVLGSDRSFNLASQAAKLCRLTDGSLGSGFSVAGAAGHLLRGRDGPPAPLADVVVADGMHLPYQVNATLKSAFWLS